MFVPKAVIQWFTDLRDNANIHAQATESALTALREELAAVRSERDVLRLQAVRDQVNFDWLKAKVNTLEFEKATLLKKLYGVEVLVPEIMRSRPNPLSGGDGALSFDDMGDEMAKQLGLQVYG